MLLLIGVDGDFFLAFEYKKVTTVLSYDFYWSDRIIRERNGMTGFKQALLDFVFSRKTGADLQPDK
ncbi:MAG: hypothetical protein SH818_17670 [Saprospiraceae bacterium]|nr:hypothetical protein [Saprospiraceae bacterium]